MVVAMQILVGDIGGTKTELLLSDRDGAVLDRRRFASNAYPSLETVVSEFLNGAHVQSAAFAVAGPVVDGRCKATNLPWFMDARSLSLQLGAPVDLLNDLAAAALGVTALGPKDMVPLAAGVRDPNGPVALIGAGTGLGEAIAVPTADGLRVLPSEGGHADFSPRNELEIDLLHFLRARHNGRVSVERVASGPGLVSLYAFVLARGLASSTRETQNELTLEDPAAVIGRRGEQGQDPACERAVSLFVSLYGAEAGNLALKVLPSGGLYVVGGIAPKLITHMQRGEFMAAMLDKGRVSDVLRNIPVAVVTSPDVNLLGARARATVVYKER
jgi:glucokinase